MKRIDNTEDAISLFVEIANEHAISFETGDFKKGNKCYTNKMKCLYFLYKNHQMKLLKEYLNNENVGVRGDTAYALLKFYPEECEKVLSEIAVGGYGFNSFNAEMVLSEWKKGTLGFPFMNMKGL
jgi:hypothetical protein